MKELGDADKVLVCSKVWRFATVLAVVEVCTFELLYGTALLVRDVTGIDTFEELE